MSIDDLLAGRPDDGPRRYSPAEYMAMLITIVAFPAIDFGLVLHLDLHRHYLVAMVALPISFTVVSFGVARRAATRPSFPWWIALGCGLICWMCSALAVLMGLFTAFYAGF